MRGALVTPARDKIAKNVPIFGRSPRPNGYATVTPISGAQSFGRRDGDPHLCRTEEMGACLRY